MKFKNILLIMLILLSVLTLTAVSASQNNATNEVIKLENSENTDNLSVEQGNTDILEQPIAHEADDELKASLNNNSSESTVLSAINTNKTNILSVSTDPSDNIVLKSAKKISAVTTIAFKQSKHYPVSKKLKTKDTLYSIYPTNPNGQFGSGITLQILNNGLSGYPLHTKVKKVKFYYKNKKTGKYKIKTVTKIRNDKICIFIKSPLFKGYKPVKAKIWYTRR